MDKINKIFIVHYKPLTERKHYLLQKFKEMNITNFEFYDKFDRNSTSQEVIDEYFKLNNLN